MKAIVCEKYGMPDVLELREVEKPVPGNGEVLVKIHAASVNQYDWHLLTADMLFVRLGSGMFKPKHTRPGADVAGRIEAVGAGVTRFRPGDEVYGEIGSGAFAEYACAREERLAPKPANLTFAQAAAVPMAALTALQGLRDKGGVRAGQAVLIHGAGGGVGTFAVQFAKNFAADVTAVCSAGNADQARALGADHVIDYAQEDFTRSGRRYDLILAVNGNRSIFTYRRALAPGGAYICIGGSPAQIFQGVLMGKLLSWRGGKKLGFVVANVNRKDLDFIRELIEAGRIRPVIERSYPLSGTAEALRHLGAGHARGKIVITMEA